MKSPWVRRALWPMTIAVLVFLFWTTPFGRVWDSLAGAAPWTVPVVGFSVILVYLADTFAAWKTFSWFAAPLTYRESLIVRGASYPIALINYALGQGAFAYFLHQRRKKLECVTKCRGRQAVVQYRTMGHGIASVFAQTNS